MQRGKYFMFEGGEGCGKDYQANLLIPWLEKRGHEVTRTREPGGTPDSEEIRRLLLDPDYNWDDMSELFLYEASRRDLIQKSVIPSLRGGKMVICTRGFPSTHAYQGFGGGMDLEFISQMNEKAMEGAMPDLLVIMDIDPKKGLEKETDLDRFAMKGLEYHQRVREGYLDVAKRYPEITKVIPYLEGLGEEMQEQIRDEISGRFNL